MRKAARFRFADGVTAKLAPTKVPMSRARLTQLVSTKTLLRGLRGLEAKAQSSPYEDWTAQHLDGVRVIPSVRRSRQTLYHTKLLKIMSLLDADSLPEATSWLCCEGIIQAYQANIVRTVVDALDAPLLFVGDLDPLDLTNFVALTYGGLEHLGSRGHRIDARYAGIDDGWLAECKSLLLPGWAAASRIRYGPAIKMNAFEESHTRWLFESFGGWE